MPADISVLNEVAVLRSAEKLEEVSIGLVEKSLKPADCSPALVELQVNGQVVHG